MRETKQGTRTVKVGVVGNPNTGKTTLFNALTGARQKTGNWPGVTVERIEGRVVHKDTEFLLVDLPGIYGLTADSEDERIARNFLLLEKPDVVLVVADSTNIERNLYLVLMLLEMGQRIVIALNMWDVAGKVGLKIDVNLLSKLLGVPCVPTVALKRKGLGELKDALLAVSQESPPLYESGYDEKVLGLLSGMAAELPEGNTAIGKFLASLYLTGEVPSPFPENRIEETRQLFKKITSTDPESYFAEHRYGRIHGIVRECVRHTLPPEKRFALTDKLDRIFTNRILGLPILGFVFYGIFWIIFGLGDPLISLVDEIFSWLGEVVSGGMASLGAPEWLSSLLGNGVIGGVGAVVVFVPVIILLYLVISVLEDCGYLARGAFVVDRIMHTFGLHGRSFIPIFLGIGCNVPAILATRTLANRRDRLLTILAAPFVPCAARLPIFTLFTAAFFTQHKAAVLLSLYTVGIAVGLLTALFMSRLLFSREEAPLIMELPPYRLPDLRTVLLTTWRRTFLFLRKAGTIIFATVILIWALASLPPGVKYASDQSLAGRLGKLIAPLLKPAGFASWQASVALLTGILAKEAVVSTMGVLYTGEEVDEEKVEEQLAPKLRRHFNPLSAFAFMLMSLLYIPCIAAIAAIKREIGWRWAALATIYSLCVGWVVGVLFYQFASLIA